jgi:DNA-binding GntR family transcriptional regulator
MNLDELRQEAVERLGVLGYVSKDEMAYQVLRGWIIGGTKLPPGSPIDHSTFAEILGLSRTPVRNAVARLITTGLVIGEVHRTPRVAPLSVDEYEDVRAARGAIEPMLISRATPHRTDAEIEQLRDIHVQQTRAIEARDTLHYVNLDRTFHRLLYQPSGLKNSLAIFEQLRDISDRYTNVYVMDQTRAERSLEEHLLILRHYEDGDADQAKQALIGHLTSGGWTEYLRAQSQRAASTESE